jgi:hypothetical protein
MSWSKQIVNQDIFEFYRDFKDIVTLRAMFIPGAANLWHLKTCLIASLPTALMPSNFFMCPILTDAMPYHLYFQLHYKSSLAF